MAQVQQTLSSGRSNWQEVLCSQVFLLQILEEDSITSVQVLDFTFVWDQNLRAISSSPGLFSKLNFSHGVSLEYACDF